MENAPLGEQVGKRGFSNETGETRTGIREVLLTSISRTTVPEDHCPDPLGTSLQQACQLERFVDDRCLSPRRSGSGLTGLENLPESLSVHGVRLIE